LWIPDDTSYDDQVTAYGLIQGQNGQMRTLGVLTTLVLGEANVAIGGTLIFPGTTPQILASNAGSTIQISANSAVQLGIIGGPQQAVLVASNGQVSLNGATVGPALLVQPGSSTISGATFQAGNGTTAVINTLWKTYNGTVLATMYSNGSFVIGTAGVAALTTGTINVANGGILGGFTVSTQGVATLATPTISTIALNVFCTANSLGVGANFYGTAENYIQVQTITSSFSPGLQFSQGPVVTGFFGTEILAGGSLIAGANAGELCFVNNVKAIKYSANNGSTPHLTIPPAGSIGIQGATPAVTAGQTDIGTTTTVTVITTVGGIGLPALASTFWVVNVNGVKYGIPCFAL
jgi:hypothetical protein